MMEELNLWKMMGIVCVICAAAATALPADAQVTFTTLTSFNGSNGSVPLASLVQGLDGDFYGTTFAGGVNSAGTVFKMTPSGTLTTLYSFCAKSNCGDGTSPASALVLGTDGNFYGATLYGGTTFCPAFGLPGGCGTLFKITPGGTLSTLHVFGGNDGAAPTGGLVLATDGNFYGTTSAGGSQLCHNGCGTVFKQPPSNKLTSLHSFTGGDGASPSGGVLQATDGNFYGTTSNLGADGHGTIFKISSAGALTTLYNFCVQAKCTDGANSNASMVQGADGNFYGTTTFGGAHGQGTVFKVTPAGAQRTLYSFCAQSNCTDGAQPVAGLVRATDGNFYGTTLLGGTGPCSSTSANGCGTIFKITPAGTLTTIHSFCAQTGCTDGSFPGDPLTQGTDGSFYGTTELGGANNSGTVFNLSVGLGPFVETLPSFGNVGEAVKILGTNLTDATSVKFNGTSATFTVVSASEISTTVPTGATSGKVQVTTSHGTLSGNVPFHVVP